MEKLRDEKLICLVEEKKMRDKKEKLVQIYNYVPIK